ncbi:protein of unknown function [Candidatus Promineifilum breve]|uniref:Uncharacterized protein n=1 Tax=Candidatus Promineifilum breve TaxID=1806508 RepID=A0A160T6E3_9CHLR|nr:hypothetical protein [Candidatus Promineifilum breve]CUS05971.1 protein of unknown function [Candidatus Promineifilum breve]
MADAESITITTNWWGFDMVMNEKLTQDIISGTETTGVLTGAIVTAFAYAGILTGGLASIIGGAFAVAFAAKVFEIKLVDNGNGVHWPITWPQLGLLLASTGGGIPGVVLGMMGWLHPFRM